MTDHQPAPETAESASALIGRLRELLKGADIPWALEQGELTGKNNRWVRIDDDRELTVFYKYGVGSVADCNKDEARARLIVGAVNELPGLLSLLTTQAAEIARLSERVERARGVIGPFGQFADAITGDKDGAEMWVYCVEHEMYLEGDVKASDFRAAADFLGETR